MARKQLFLTLDKADFPKVGRGGAETCWVFLGRDYERLTRLRRTAPPEFKYLDLGDLLNETSNDNRRTYLDYIAGLSRDRAGLPWWISPVAEKNTMANPAYLYVCYLMIIKQLLGTELKDKNICIFSESPALLETIARAEFAKSRRVVRSYSYRGYLAFELIRAVYRVCQFTIKSLKRKAAALATRPGARRLLPGISELTLVRTWVSANNITKDGGFKELYLPGLREYLDGKQIKTAILPIVNVSDNFTYTEAMRRFRRSDLDFIIPEDYYRLSDYIRTVVVSVSSLAGLLQKHIFKSLDLSLIFQAESLGCFLLWETDQVLMHYFLLKRLRQQGLKINRIIITFENMFPEKPIIIGKSEFLPNAKVIGFQHVCLYPLMLSSYTSKQEIDLLPMPDEIICSGPFSRDILVKEGFPASRLSLGPALRFQYLLQAGRDHARPEKPVILIPLTLAKPMALELLIKMAGTLRACRLSAEVWIKPHPMMGEAEISGLLDQAQMPAGSYLIVKGSMAELLPRATVMVTTATATIFDAIAFGTPVIRVRSDINVNLDPMDWFPKDELHYAARTPGEIERELRKIFSLNAEQVARISEHGKNMIGLCFYPANEATLSEFIK